MLRVVIACTLVAAALASDAACTGQSGTCQDDSLHCAGTYHAGLCDGAASRRCCVPTATHTAATGNYNCYGNFMSLHPTGASAQTARQDGITHGGPTASHQMVTNDIAALNQHKNCYVQAGQKNCVHPAVIAAIASRETRGGKLIAHTGGWGDNHHAYGIMQCDGGASGLHAQCTAYPWDSCAHIEMMTRLILVPFIKTIKAKHPTWHPEQQLMGGVSAYNAGPGNVATFAGMDLGTTGNDYANDVIARAQYLVSHFGW